MEGLFTEEDIESAAPYWVADIMRAYNFLATNGYDVTDKETYLNEECDKYQGN